MTDRSRIFFIVFAVLGIYYASLFGEINTIDDQKMIGLLAEQARNTDWVGLFIPKSGVYYRPLLLATYVADTYLWDMSESFMHLENILLHALNAVLVFLLARKVFPSREQQNSELPLIAALIFAWHPINTESVAWISGRTDPLAAVFILVSAVFIFKGIEGGRFRHFILATISLMLGCLCKEVAVFFLPAACFIVVTHAAPEDADSRLLSREKLKRLVLLVGPFFLCGVVYLVMRFASFSSRPSLLFQGMARNGTLLNNLRIVLKVFGFYTKKLFQPLPLNFAIFEASERYVWVGAVAIVVLLLIVRKRHVLSAFAVTAAILIIPAILVTLTHVAWTPLAERYLYLPSAFFGIALVGAVDSAGQRFGCGRLAQILLVLSLIPSAIVTAQRTITWQSNFALYQDTLQKSPDSMAIKNEFASALARRGRNAEAEGLLVSAMAQDPRKEKSQLYVNQAELKVCSGDLEGARAYLLGVKQVQNPPDPLVLRKLAKIDEARLFKPLTDRTRREVFREIGELHAQLYKLTGEPLDLYRGGQMALKLGEKEKARQLFDSAYRAAPEDAYFKPAAKKLAKKLKP